MGAAGVGGPRGGAWPAKGPPPPTLGSAGSSEVVKPSE